MKLIALILGLLLVLLQYRLWFGDGGVLENRRLEATVAQLRAQVAERRERNAALEAEIEDLKHNLEAVEERARRDLGLIRPEETYVMIVER